MIKRIALATICSLVCVSSAYAQACLGAIGFKDAPTQAGGILSISSDEHTFSGGITHGTDAYFVKAGASYLDLDGVSATGVDGMVGREIHLQNQPKLFICPTVIVSKVFGPSPAPDINDGEFLMSFGASVGFDATTSGTTRIVPTFGYSFNYVRESQSGTDAFGAPVSGSFSDSFSAIQLGVGLIFNEHTSLIPMVLIPIGSDVGENVFIVRFGVKFH